MHNLRPHPPAFFACVWCVNVTHLSQTRSLIVFFLSLKLLQKQRELRLLKAGVAPELDAGLKGRVRACVRACGVRSCPFQREGKQCLAHSHIALKEFLDIKAGVMTVKAALLLTQRCHAHT